MSKLETNTIDTISGTNTLQVGDGNVATINLGKSGDTINVPSGATLNVAGTVGTGLTNTPAFEAQLSSSQTVTDNTTTKVQYNIEVFDTDNAYDNSTNYRFQPQVAGKYFVYAKVGTDTIAGANLDQVRIFIKKNGTGVSKANLDARGNTLGAYYTINDSATVVLNGSSDYIEIYCKIDDTSGNPDFQGHPDDGITTFGAYRIIGA